MDCSNKLNSGRLFTLPCGTFYYKSSLLFQLKVENFWVIDREECTEINIL